MISKEDIQKLIEATDMVALVSPYTKLIKSGSGYKALCPFHHEDTPSFNVSQEKHLAYCFGCHKGGDPIKFLMEIKHIDFMEAVRELAKINNMPLALEPVNQVDLQNEKYYKLNALAQEFYTRNLWTTKSGEEALNYLRKRGLSDDEIKEFKIGLAPKERDILYKVLKDSGFLELDMVDAGLVKASGDGYTDVFTKRIMYPLEDEKSRVLGFSGRIYLPDDKMAKYMNTTDTPVFKKNMVIYNLNRALGTIKDKNRVIVHEGFMDVIATYRAGLKEVVCSMGTQLTQNQIRVLRRYTKNVILAFDSDKAGILATYRAKDMFEAEGFSVKVFEIKNAKDSDEYVFKYGKDKYVEFFNNNLLDALDYTYNTLIKGINLQDNDKVESVKEQIFILLKKKQSAIIADKYLKRLASDLNISLDVLYRDYNYSRYAIPTPSIKRKEKKPAVVVASLFEVRLFEYAKASKEYAMYLDSLFTQENLLVGFDELNQRIWYALMDHYQHYNDFSEEKFIEDLKVQNLYDKYHDNIQILNKLPLPYNKEEREECLERLKMVAKTRQSEIIQNNIKNAEPKLGFELLNRKYDLRKK